MTLVVVVLSPGTDQLPGLGERRDSASLSNIRRPNMPWTGRSRGPAGEI